MQGKPIRLVLGESGDAGDQDLTEEEGVQRGPAALSAPDGLLAWSWEGEAAWILHLHIQPPVVFYRPKHTAFSKSKHHF